MSQEINRMNEPPQILVLVHAHFPELLADLLVNLQNIQEYFDVLITSTFPLLLSDAKFMLDNCKVRDLKIVQVDNRGRDILPMLLEINNGSLDGYPLVLKIHTKKSPWRENNEDFVGSGDQWRNKLIESLIGTKLVVEKIIRSFEEIPEIGLITARGSICDYNYWGSDRTATIYLASAMGLLVTDDSLLFPSGSMYWVRGELLSNLKHLGFSKEQFEAERGQDDGTLAHCVERLIGYLCAEAGYALADIDGSLRLLKYESKRDNQIYSHNNSSTQISEHRFNKRYQELDQTELVVHQFVSKEKKISGSGANQGYGYIEFPDFTGTRMNPYSSIRFRNLELRNIR